MTALAPRVLVVDDDPSFARLVADLLEEEGYDVLATDDHAAALAHVAARGCDVAVLDLVMPGASGLELGDQIRGRSPDTQILILTGQGDMESAVRGIQHGVFDFLDKSATDLLRLRRSVGEAVQRSRLERTNRQLVVQLKESNRLLGALHELSAPLVGEAHQDRVLTNLVRAAKELAGVATGRALLFARTHSGDLVVESAAGDGAGTLVGTRLGAGEGIAPWVADTGGKVVAGRATESERFCARCDAMPTHLPQFLAVPLRHGSRHGALLVAGRTSGPFADEEQAMVAALGEQAAVALENAAYHEQSINFSTHVCDLLVTVLEQVDVFYPGHSRAVASLSDMVTRRMGLGDAERRTIHFGALLHDIGKVMVGPALLRATHRATGAEWEAMRAHPTLGLDALKSITLWEDLLPIVHSHHERWDGTGYPLGLAGEQIPLGARVVAVADAFDAMTRSTPHGNIRTPEQALAEVDACAGTQFDPRVARLFVAEYRRRGDEVPRA